MYGGNGGDALVSDGNTADDDMYGGDGNDVLQKRGSGLRRSHLMPVDRGVLTTEFKINLPAPAAGERIIARGKVVKAGRTLTLAQTEVFAEDEGKQRLIALLTATLMAIEGKDGIAD